MSGMVRIEQGGEAERQKLSGYLSGIAGLTGHTLLEHWNPDSVTRRARALTIRYSPCSYDVEALRN